MCPQFQIERGVPSLHTGDVVPRMPWVNLVVAWGVEWRCVYVRTQTIVMLVYVCMYVFMYVCMYIYIIHLFIVTRTICTIIIADILHPLPSHLTLLSCLCVLVYGQFLETVWQCMSQFPTAFEFNDKLLISLCDHSHSGWFGTFLGNK